MKFTRHLFTLVAVATAAVAGAQTTADADRLAAEGKTSQAITAYEAVVAKTADDGQAWYGLGRVLYDQERYDESRNAFERALALGFQPGGAHLRLGMIAIETGDLEGGIEQLTLSAEAGVPVARMLSQFPVWKKIEASSQLTDAIASLHPCASPNHRAFDFWIGEWDVYSPQGRKLGTNKIEKILDGCVLLESWQGQSSGHSFNRFDAAQEKWIQRWVDDGGNALDMRGSFENGRMQLDVGHEEGQSTQRWTWTPLSGGRVRQMAEQPDPESGEWRVTWDSIYVPKGTEFSAEGL